MGVESCGYDINPHAIKLGNKHFPSLDLRCADIASDDCTFGLLTLVDMLEHIKTPLPFMQSVVRKCAAGGLVYISVPRLDEDKWQSFTEPTEDQYTWSTASPFHDNDVHVVHYSTKGLIELGGRVGLSVVGDFNNLGWPLNGVLFKRNL